MYEGTEQILVSHTPSHLDHMQFHVRHFYNWYVLILVYET